MPSRRALLRICASGTLLGVAGCPGSGGDAPGETTTDTIESATISTAAACPTTTAEESS